jgi:uncharacterized protein (TIGR03437 family)
MCLHACPAAAQRSSALANLGVLCNQIQSDLDCFNTSMSTGWSGVETPVAFGAELTTADCNRGLATLPAPGTFAQILSQLNALAPVGVQPVTACTGFPLLYQPFYQYKNDLRDYALFLAFYQKFVQEAASAAMRGGQLSSVEHSYAAAIGSVGWPVRVSAASGTAPVARESIVAINRSNLASTGTPATSLPLLFTLAGSSVTVTDDTGPQPAMPLFYAGPQQIDTQIPDSLNTGPAVLTIATPSGGVQSTVMLPAVALGSFAANGNGQGAAAAQFVTTHAEGSSAFGDAFTCPSAPGTCTAVSIDLGGPGDQTALVLYGAGIRNRAALSDVTVEICGQSLPAANAGPVATLVGLDQVNIFLPHSLAGSGTVNLSVSAARTTSNMLAVTFQ